MKGQIPAKLTGFSVESLEEYFLSLEGYNASSRKTEGLLPDSELEGMRGPSKKPKIKSPEASTFVWVQGESKTK